MVEVYFYIPAHEVGNAIECGLKLSKWFDRSVVINGEERKCIATLLNPKDDIEKYKSSDYKCLKFELLNKYCFVGDGYLYRAGLNSPTLMEMYISSLISVDDYIFGFYRLPECLVTTTVIAEQVNVLDKRLDSPVLFNNSEELYVNNIIEAYKEENDDFNDVMLYYFYCKLSEMGSIDKEEDLVNKIAVFSYKNKKRAVTIKIPDMSKY